MAVFLRLLLIVTLACNGLAAPHAAAHAGGDGDHAAMGHGAAAHDHAAMRHDDSSMARGHDDRGHESRDATAPMDCCDGAGCDCGCVLPPMLMRVAVASATPPWSIAPSSEPAVGPLARHALPPFRPPAG